MVLITVPIGIDIGGNVKVAWGEQSFYIPSIIGSPNPGWSGISPNKEWTKNLILVEDDKSFYIGELARLQSEIKRMITEKGQIEQLDDVSRIIKAVLALFVQDGQQIVLATGVPISTSLDLMKKISLKLKGPYNIHIRNDATSEEKKIKLEIIKTLVLPEAYGSYYQIISSSETQTASDAIIISLDYFTEILTIYQGIPMRLASRNLIDASLSVLTNKIALALQKSTNRIVSSSDLLPNIQQNKNKINVAGKIYDISESKEFFIRKMGIRIADQIEILISKLPPDAEIEYFIITGEGANVFWKEIQLNLLEKGIIEDLDKVIIPEDSILTNVRGFENLARKVLIRDSL
ncbi:MAG: hypothetical protein ACTSRG_08035 [Candidatus Helarchaeota archaeon]